MKEGNDTTIQINQAIIIHCYKDPYKQPNTSNPKVQSKATIIHLRIVILLHHVNGTSLPQPDY